MLTSRAWPFAASLMQYDCMICDFWKSFWGRTSRMNVFGSSGHAVNSRKSPSGVMDLTSIS